MRRKKEDAEITRKQLLEAGLRVFSEKGYAATRLSDIAEEAGVTRGAIYWHFGNKKELFIALYKERVDPIFDNIREIFQQDIAPLEKIATILKTFFDKLQYDKDVIANQHLEFTEMELRNDIPEIKEYIQSRGDKFYITLVKIIIAGVERGEIRKDIDPDAVTSMLAVLMAGYGFLSARKEHKPLYREGNSDEIINIFIDGIRAR